MDAETNDLLQRFGDNFARKYYATLSERPRDLTRFYGKHSMLVHGVSRTDIRTAVGEKDVRDCVARLRDRGAREAHSLSVTTRRVLDYVVISVTGELLLLTAERERRRRFTQTIVLGGDRGRNDEYECAIKNDMFFYVDGDAKGQDDSAAKKWRRDQRVSNFDNINRPPLRYLQSSDRGKCRPLHYPPASHQIFVSGIPGSVRPQTLRRFFGRYGELHSLRVMRKNVNYGFVTFLDAESVRVVLRNRPILFPDDDDDDDAVWLVVKRKKTAQAHEDREKVYLPLSHQLFIGDVPDRVTSDDLKQFFNKWGEVVNARIVVVREKAKSDEEVSVHGFVTFKTENSAKAILENRPIVFPHESGRVELTITEKFRRPFRNSRHFVREKLRRERKQ